MFRDLIEMIRTPSAEVLAQRELDDARRRLLEAQAGQEYAAAMVQYHKARIARLDHFLRTQKGGQE